jgi:DivIVA domain-containing protein
MSPESPLDATGIARRQFSTARRGFDPAEVRAYLHELSAVVGRLQRGEAHEHERAERAESRAQLAEQLDQHRLVELLGEETARVLEAAREAAGDIRTHAEESAARMVRDAQAEARAITDRAEKEAAARRIEILAEADALRREAEDEVERRRVEGQVVVDDMRREAGAERERMLAEGERARGQAESAAEQIRASAREQGRRLVGEAQAVRERILGDLSRRRRTAREQLERLNGARERLLAAYEVVRRTVDEATAELTVALPEAKVASEMAMRRVIEEPEETVEVIEAELSVARMAGLVDDVAASAVTDDELDTMLRELAEEEAAQAAAAAGGRDTGGTDAPGPDPHDGDPADTNVGGGVAVADQPVAAAEDPGADGPIAADDDATGVGAATAAGPDAGATAERPGARPPAEGEKWGIRLPRARPLATQPQAEPGSAPVVVAPSVPSAPAADPGRAPAPATARAGDAPPAEAAEDEGETGPYVDELFARIRAERGPGAGSSDRTDRTPGPPVADQNRAVAVAVRSEVDVEVPPDGSSAGGAAAEATARPHDADRADEPDEPGETTAAEPDPATWLLHRRDDLLASAERELGRKLKRVLADEQNEVLDLLRQGGTIELTDVVPAADEHADRFAIAATRDLDAAAAHGAALAGGETVASCDELAATLGRILVEPLRARIERSFDDCDGDLEEVTERLRALYREWKGNHIGIAVRHFTAAAYARGAYDAIPDGAALRWLVDLSCDACPDCDDNALAGQVPKGEAFPTGDALAPAHPDCRCLVVPARTLDVS